tara:strand:+ start:36202 stop:36465 length:264 start_codon:yes stop_codon:yes gene_type:complete
VKTVDDETSNRTALKRLWTSHSLLDLVSPVKVTDQATKVVTAVNDYYFGRLDDMKCSDGEMRNPYDRIVFERGELVRLMKQDGSELD